jgi:hypothetical protein
MHIVDIITKIATQNPELRQELIDLTTLGYREGLISGKLNSIIEDEEMEPDEVDVSDLLPAEMKEIINETENWFRSLMTLNARAMVAAHDVMAPIPLHANRLQIAMDQLAAENPGLFD